MINTLFHLLLYFYSLNLHKTLWRLFSKISTKPTNNNGPPLLLKLGLGHSKSSNPKFHYLSPETKLTLCFLTCFAFSHFQNPKTSAISHSHSCSTEKREMLRSILRAATATSSKPKPHSWTLQSSPIPTPPPPQYSFSSARNYSVKNAKSTTATKGKKGKFNKSGEDAAPAEVDAAVSEAQARARRLAMDEKDPTLNVGPNGLPLFTSTPSLSLLSRKDTCSYFKFRYPNQNFNKKPLVFIA